MNKKCPHCGKGIPTNQQSCLGCMAKLVNGKYIYKRYKGIAK